MSDANNAETDRLYSASPSARRMRRLRRRKRQQLRCITSLEIREREVDVLIAKGLLPRDQRDDNSAVKRALYRFLDGELKMTVSRRPF